MRKAILCFLEKDNQILLLHTDYGSKVVWNGVSGYIDEGEKETDTAVREIKEEIGVEVSSQDLVHVGTHGIFTVFILKKWSGTPAPQEESILELQWFSKDNLPYSQMHEGNDAWLPEMINDKNDS